MTADRIKAYYAREIEKNRLEMDIFLFEGIRTKEILSRYLSSSPINILDVGGGAGYYAFWLQRQGHHVTLVDLSPKNIELVKAREFETGIPLTHVELGNATDLQFPDHQFDLVLVFGPLYHLIERKDRIKAFLESKRVVKPGGIIVSAFISRYASLFDGFKRDLVNDPHFEKLLKQDLISGLHENETENPDYFTTAYFHTPSQIKEEIQESGLQFEKLIAVESFGWMIDDLIQKSKDTTYMERLLYFIREVEMSEDLMAMSPHIIAVASKELN